MKSDESASVPHVVERIESVDLLTRDGRVLILFDRSLVELGPLGAAIFDYASEPITLDDLAAKLEAEFGPPLEGTTMDAVVSSVTGLVQQGVLKAEYKAI